MTQFDNKKTDRRLDGFCFSFICSHSHKTLQSMQGGSPYFCSEKKTLTAFRLLLADTDSHTEIHMCRTLSVLILHQLIS